LDGKVATTHWCRSADFGRRYPRVLLQPDKIFVRSGKVWTSAGISAGIDLALAMIAADHGDAVARAVARQLVVYYQRPGGQTQFSALLELPSASRFAELLDYLRCNLAEPLRIEDLAKRVAMSPRNFCRLFTSELGVTPARAVERLRLEAARAELEAGCAVAEVAQRCGFGDAERLRRVFVRRLGISPSHVRRGERDGSPGPRGSAQRRGPVRRATRSAVGG
jgi:transcriptional regulator GlxA family with amidase domain